MVRNVSAVYLHCEESPQLPVASLQVSISSYFYIKQQSLICQETKMP